MIVSPRASVPIREIDGFNGGINYKNLTTAMPYMFSDAPETVEMLAVDLIKPMGSVLPFEVVREKEFAPIKNKTGVDSVESARELLKLNGVEL